MAEHHLNIRLNVFGYVSCAVQRDTIAKDAPGWIDLKHKFEKWRPLCSSITQRSAIGRRALLNNSTNLIHAFLPLFLLPCSALDGVLFPPLRAAGDYAASASATIAAVPFAPTPPAAKRCRRIEQRAAECWRTSRRRGKSSN